MQPEFEVKILDINVDKLIDKLKSLGATKHSDRIMRRYIYDMDKKDSNCWLRLRDEGDKITLCIKEIHDSTIGGTKETEIEVSSFEETNTILEKLGYRHRLYQENRRISYRLGKTHIEIDYWPMIPPYLEIEAASRQTVEKTVQKLGFELPDALTLSTREVYKKYGLDIDKFKELRLK